MHLVCSWLWRRRFAGNHATYSLATPYDTIRDSASHLKGSELVEVPDVVVSGLLPLGIFG
jgi:hypothetical protein